MFGNTAQDCAPHARTGVGGHHYGGNVSGGCLPDNTGAGVPVQDPRGYFEVFATQARGDTRKICPCVCFGVHGRGML
jgi:hypothetical protein